MCSTAWTSTSGAPATRSSRRSRSGDWKYHREHFFEDGVVPRYFDNRLHPVDATACAQSLLTLSRFGDLATAERVAHWVIRHMQRRDGAFVYQRRARYVVRTPFMRWSVAWLFCAFSAVLHALHEHEARGQ
jgi:hypothetical protein